MATDIVRKQNMGRKISTINIQEAFEMWLMLEVLWIKRTVKDGIHLTHDLKSEI